MSEIDLFGDPVAQPSQGKRPRKTAEQKAENTPEKLAKAIRLPVLDFSNPNRKPSCLEIDFPIAQINALSQLEGNAGKPIYQMSKWWARRRSSVFRSMLIAAATQAPDDASEAAKLVWEHYYCNHQKANSFKKLRVLDCFMGGGTTLVEGARLGMQMTGVDLNPVAWFVVKNELACSDPEQVRHFFAQIEAEVKPLIQPFYTTTCPRGHVGRWVDSNNGEPVDVDPLELSPEARSGFRWEGPEVIYTFWAKHGPCQAKDCTHRTPIFRTPIIAEKKLSTAYIECTCPDCGIQFHAELGETRMAPDAERVVLEGAPLFTEFSQPFAKLLNDYDKGNVEETFDRAWTLKESVANEPGLCCPSCGGYASKPLSKLLERHADHAVKTAERKKKAFGIKTKSVQMYLLIHPEWLKGASGYEGEHELGGWAGASADSTAAWFQRRLHGHSVIEVRGYALPDFVELADGTTINTSLGTVPKQAHFTCGQCGKSQDRMTAIKSTMHTGPVAVYALQCHCPQCAAEGYTYGGRYFKAPDSADIKRLIAAEKEWELRHKADLDQYWPQTEIQHSMRTHVKDPLPDHGYTHWWKMFNPRQLLVHSQLLHSITEATEDLWPFDVREQALGAFQQYLRNQNMFAIWNITADKMEPFFSESNYNPKNLTIENCVFPSLGRGNWESSSAKCVAALEWARKPWERTLTKPSPSEPNIALTEDPIVLGTEIFCGSSTDLSQVSTEPLDLVITDPPFGDNVYYADLADYFYCWLRIALVKWYAGLPEEQYFLPERTPHSMEAIDNSAEHPDDREEYEKSTFITAKHLQVIRELSGDTALIVKDPNPLYLPVPASDFYSKTLGACWAEAGRLLKDGGIMGFTFHHSEDSAWIDVLKALFDAGYLLVATYPIRSDESKGENAAFGSKKIEYDIIHVCRKRLEAPQPVSWSRMRRWVKEETQRLKEMLEHTHAKELPESDLRVILRGKALEFYSRHYGQVLTGDGQILEVRDALLGINLLLDDLVESSAETGSTPPPESAEPTARLYLRIFRHRSEIPRDELHKLLGGSGISQGDLESRGWIRVVGKAVNLVPIQERFLYFTERGRNRKVIKTDLDQAHFLIGAAYPNSGYKIAEELDNASFRIKKSVDDILKWYMEIGDTSATRSAATTALRLVEHWRTRTDRPQTVQLTLFEMLEEGA